MKLLQKYALEYGVELSEAMLEDFSTYEQLLIDWNTRMNLTAITAHNEVIVKHFLDSLLLFDAVDIPLRSTVMDVGTGAGFPGIPMKIVREDLHLTLLDSLQKRVAFLKAVSDKLGQQNRCLHSRAEDAARNPIDREQYDLVTARAVAALPILAEYCLPFVRVGGVFAAMKGPDAKEETEGARAAIQLLGGELMTMKHYQLPNMHNRSIVCVKKISQTPTKYPRNSAKIAKMPL